MQCMGCQNNEEDVRTDEQKGFYLKNTDWEPPAARVNKEIDVYQMMVQNKFDQWKQRKRLKDNLSVAQRKTLKTLQNGENIDIKRSLQPKNVILRKCNLGNL